MQKKKNRPANGAYGEYALRDLVWFRLCAECSIKDDPELAILQSQSCQLVHGWFELPNWNGAVNNLTLTQFDWVIQA